MNQNKKKSRKYKKRRSVRRHTTRNVIISLLLLLIVGAGFRFYYEVAHSKPAEVWFRAESQNTSKVSLPADDAPHSDKVEWWYYNGHLTAKSGKQYSFHYTIFLVNGMMTHTIAHVSLTDHQTRKHYTAQRRSGGNPSIGTVNEFKFPLNDWLMKGGDGFDELQVKTDEFSFDLKLTNTIAPVMHGEAGIIPLDTAGSSYYYSRTRMAVSGMLHIGKHHEPVEGISWFDHQWGNFSVGQLAWDWFSLQMDDGADIMLYQLRDKGEQPVLYTGSISREGVTKVLAADEFVLTPGKKWVSKKTGKAYPLEWKISIPQQNIKVTTRGVVNDSEFDASLTTYKIYWEGAVKVGGSHAGKGFMELSGY